MLGVDTKEIYVGEEANSKKGILNLDYPIKNGVVKNWEGNFLYINCRHGINLAICIY